MSTEKIENNVNDLDQATENFINEMRNSAEFIMLDPKTVLLMKIAFKTGASYGISATRKIIEETFNF